MRLNSWRKCVLAVTLMVALITTGCSAQWISVALADLPVLTQMALNIASLVVALQSGQQMNPAEAAAIQNISAEAGRDLNLLQSLYNQYKANPDATTLQKIQDEISAINQNLPVLLQAAHISNPTLNGRVTAAVNLILVTVDSFAALIPQSAAASVRVAARSKLNIPSAKELKRQWNQQVCAPTGNVALDATLEGCVIR
ncbi:MAG TPA: hypothetical protein VN684_08090 [Terriglobales bacterium]|nr:hypothetical protein [Terriglobales bacterium]